MTGFGELIGGLNAMKVDYVIVGGIAVIRHGVVRATRDVDAVVAGDERNLAAIRELIVRWGATRPDGSPVPADAVAPGRSVHLDTPHGQLDLLPERRPGPTFSELRARADVKRIDGMPAPIVSLADLVALKRAAGRERDRLDLLELQVVHGSLPELPTGT